MPGKPDDEDEGLDDELRDLQAFVIQLRDLLRVVADDGRYTPTKRIEDVREAWPEARDSLNERWRR
jgi:hypothetical protein